MKVWYEIDIVSFVSVDGKKNWRQYTRESTLGGARAVKRKRQNDEDTRIVKVTETREVVE